MKRWKKKKKKRVWIKKTKLGGDCDNQHSNCVPRHQVQEEEQGSLGSLMVFQRLMCSWSQGVLKPTIHDVREWGKEWEKNGEKNGEREGENNETIVLLRSG